MLNGRLVLVINASYEPISICSARRAIKLIVKGTAKSIENYDEYVWRDMKLPSVIKLETYRKVPKVCQVVSRRGVLSRDQYVCQYCRKWFTPSELTLDHVLPISRNGGTTWDNLVAACRPCNRKKANRTPEEAGMPLLNAPKAVTLHTSRYLMRTLAKKDDRWKKYLYF